MVDLLHLTSLPCGTECTTPGERLLGPPARRRCGALRGHSNRAGSRSDSISPRATIQPGSGVGGDAETGIAGGAVGRVRAAGGDAIAVAVGAVAEVGTTAHDARRARR